MDELREALVDRIESDIAILRQGIEWIESGVFKITELQTGWVIDQALKSYRRAVADLERQLSVIREED